MSPMTRKGVRDLSGTARCGTCGVYAHYEGEIGRSPLSIRHAPSCSTLANSNRTSKIADITVDRLVEIATNTDLFEHFMVTWQLRYSAGRDTHPVLTADIIDVDPDGWMDVYATDEQAARESLGAYLDGDYAFIYPAHSFNPKMYHRGSLGVMAVDYDGLARIEARRG